MQFPAWVEGGRMSKAQRATARLKFILNHLALHYTGRNSMRALAEKVGYDHSTLSTYIRRGSFSQQAADEIVEKLECTATIKAEHLVDPLSIINAGR